jgi:hypothetical protein
LPAAEASRAGGRSTGSGFLDDVAPPADLATHAASTFSPDSLSKTRVDGFQSCTAVDTVKALAAVASKQADAPPALVWRTCGCAVSMSLGVAAT